MSGRTALSVTRRAQAQELQDRLGSLIRAFMAGRTSLEAPMFDMPVKMAFGHYCNYDVLPDMVDAIDATVSRDDVARRLRAVGFPRAISMPSFPWNMELGRLQTYLHAGWPEQEVDVGDAEATARVLTWWADVMRAYRSDGEVLPGRPPARAQMPIIDAADVAALADGAHARGPATDVPVLRRALAQLEVYLFMIHAETRIGIFHHGPYELGGGDVLVVKELTGLEGRNLPWMEDKDRPPTSRVVVPMVLHDVECQFDLFGSLSTAPQDHYGEHLVAFDVLAGDELTSIDVGQLRSIAADATRIQTQVFLEMAGWDDRDKIFHSAFTHACVYCPLLEAVGLADRVGSFVQRYADAGERYLERFLGGERSAMWDYIASGRDPLFPPVA